MRITILNWKDPKNPDAGGAEVYALQMGKHLASVGHHVTWIARGFPGAPPKDRMYGISIVRVGNRLSVYSMALRYLRKHRNTDPPDIVIDAVNTRPFFAERAVDSGSTRVCNLIHQLAREVWFEETPFPLALAGRFFLEDWWLRRISHLPTVTVSDSTADDLKKLGFRKVTIIPNGATEPRPPAKSNWPEPPSVLFIGRLSRGKRPDHALRAVALARKQRDFRFTVVGTGPMSGRLARAYPNEEFVGRVSDGEKRRLLENATLLLVPGTREGWGQVVLEAQSFGVVPIAYNVQGLRDAVNNGSCGILVENNTPTAMSQSLVRLLSDAAYRQELSRRCQVWASHFSWTESAAQFERLLREITYQEPPRSNVGVDPGSEATD